MRRRGTGQPVVEAGRECADEAPGTPRHELPTTDARPGRKARERDGPAQAGAPAPRLAHRERPFRAVGSRIAGRYRVEAVLGKGGMGSVYRVLDESCGASLALKQLTLHRGTRKEWQRLRFRREFHTMARLYHPRIVEVYDFGVEARDDGREAGAPYYTMEILDGLDLRDVGPVAVDAACGLLRDVALALAFLHNKRLIHRDLAPRNVRCTTDGRAKLIDFGVLATAGTFGDVAGTPPFVAPENVRGLPIDHRADLYGLGALAYWVLTGKHAYPARRIDELSTIWEDKPAPPSTYAEGIGLELDQLVMSMLSLDPLGRPSAAAEVVDRLGALGRLAPVPEEEATRGYLASAVLVGRQREVELLRRRAQKAHRGEGSAIVIEAPGGTGKSRLLRELSLEAQVVGATVVEVGGATGKGPYGTLRALSRALLAACPDDAWEAARRRAPVIARVLPELNERLGRVQPAAPLGDPTEERARLQSDLVQLFLDVARRRTLAVLVDDVQRSDEASAAVLALLAHAAPTRRLLLVAAQRTDEPPRAAAAVAALRDGSARVRLRGLEVEDVEDLVRGLFGQVPGGARLAMWLQRAAGGSPLHCLELARHLVDRGVVRCVDGIWSVPEDLRLEAVPTGLAEALRARIATLGAPARALAEALSVHGGELTLPLCALLAEGTDATASAGDGPSPELFTSLDELLYEEVLISDGDTYRFRHDGIREAVLRSLDQERRRRLHLRVGRALGATGEVSPESETEVGWHLLWGGERSRGAALLSRAGTRLYEAQSFSDAIAPLEAALEVYEAEERVLSERLALRHMLVMAGAMSDRKVTLRYGDDTIAILRRLSGVELATRLRGVLGSRLAFALALGWAWLGWVVAGRGSRPAPLQALHLFYVEVAYLASARSLSLHHAPLRGLVELLAPLAIFRNRVAHGAYLLAQNLLGMALGFWGTVRRNSPMILTILETDTITPISEMDRRNAEGAARYMLAMVAALEQDPAHARELARLEGLDLRFFDVSAMVCRVVFHRLRGEEDTALELEGRVEVQLVQLGSMWGPESTLQWVSSLAYGLTRDVLGLRRRIEALQRLVNAGYELEPHLQLAIGEYQRERGELDAARSALQKCLSLLTEDEAFIRPAALCALAETHLARRLPDEARPFAERALRLAADADLGNATWRLRAERTLALIEVALGELAPAADRLDRSIAEATPTGSPSLCGALHEARVRVAALAGDVQAYEIHRRETEKWFRSTRNPALIARLERLPEAPQSSAERPHGVGAHGVGDRSAAGSPAAIVPRDGDLIGAVSDSVTLGSSTEALSDVLTGCRGAGERATRALSAIVEASSATSGYLYLLKEGGLALVAPLSGEEPPDAVVTELVRRLSDGSHSSAEMVTHVDWPAPEPVSRSGGAGTGDAPSQERMAALPWRAVILGLRVGGRTASIGAAAVVGGVLPLRAPRAALLARLGRELYEAGDVIAGSGAHDG